MSTIIYEGPVPPGASICVPLPHWLKSGDNVEVRIEKVDRFEERPIEDVRVGDAVRTDSGQDYVVQRLDHTAVHGNGRAFLYSKERLMQQRKYGELIRVRA